MKTFITVQMFLLSLSILANDAIKTKIEEKFSGSPIIEKELKDLVKNLKALNSTLDDKKKYIPAKRAVKKNFKCLQFLSEGVQEKYQSMHSVVQELYKTPEFKDFQKKDFKMMMDRQTREAFTKGIDEVDTLNSSKFCSSKISPMEALKIKTAHKSNEEEAVRNHKKDDYSAFHPVLQKMLQNMDKRLAESNPKMTAPDVEGEVYETFIKILAPTLNTKAKLETLKTVEKNCKGKTEELWKVCNGKKHFQSMANKMFPSMMRLLCLIDHKEKVPSECIEPEKLELPTS